jgi:signal transduction histidine kinase
VDRLARLSERLLMLARADAGALVRDRRPHLLGPLLHDAVRRRDSVGSAHVDVPDDLELRVDADAFGLAVDNLVGNSARAAGPAGTVRVSAFRSDGHVVVEVADDGPGFDPEFLPKAFNRFSRGDSSRASGSGGAGLGLSIVRAVAEAHGGTAEVFNGRKGAVARLRFPDLPQRRLRSALGSDNLAPRPVSLGPVGDSSERRNGVTPGRGDQRNHDGQNPEVDG